jgi:hypothetical protein
VDNNGDNFIWNGKKDTVEPLYLIPKIAFVSSINLFVTVPAEAAQRKKTHKHTTTFLSRYMT